MEFQQPQGLPKHALPFHGLFGVTVYFTFSFVFLSFFQIAYEGVDDIYKKENPCIKMTPKVLRLWFSENAAKIPPPAGGGGGGGQVKLSLPPTDSSRVRFVENPMWLCEITLLANATAAADAAAADAAADAAAADADAAAAAAADAAADAAANAATHAANAAAHAAHAAADAAAFFSSRGATRGRCI